MQPHQHTNKICIEKGDTYLDLDGRTVFTEQYLLKRGYCCENNCRHCPYGFRLDTFKEAS